ncbi:MAG: DUF3857 and transglutaminase domain-containing protein [Acidobacteriota bacterium]|jgi:transglutaminase-like putative cysteine protease
MKRILLFLCTGLLAAAPATDAAGSVASRDAVLLEESLRIRVLSPTEAEVEYENRTRLLTQRGVERYGFAVVGYNPWVAVADFRGSIVLPDGKRTKVRKSDISDQSDFASYELYSDNRRKVMRFTGAAPGATVEHSYRTRIRSLFFLPRRFLLADELPGAIRTLTVDYPASTPFRFDVRGTAEETHRTDGDREIRSWTARDTAAVEFDPGSPPAADLLPRVSLFPEEILWEDHRIDSTTWDGIASWYAGLARDGMQPDADVSRLTAEVVAGAGSGDERIRRIYEFVQRQVQYVAVELGVGGWKPHPSGEVLHHRYGDCKDKATLMIAMLRATGLDGNPVLVRTRDAGRTDPEQPVPSFNHAIVAVPAEDGFLFLDPTATTIPYGDLPWGDQGVNALVVLPDGTAQIVPTPLTPPEHNRLHHRVEAALDVSGRLSGIYVLEATGQRRAEISGALGVRDERDRAAYLSGLLGELCPGALLRSHEIEPAPGPEEPLRIRMEFEVPRYAARAGSALLVGLHPTRSNDLIRLGGQEQRDQPVFFPYLFRDTASVRLRLPPGRSPRKLPESAYLNAPGFEATATYRERDDPDGTVLEIERSVSVSRRAVPVKEFAAWRDAIAGLAREDVRAVTLERSEG